MDISENIQDLKKELPEGVTLVAISKTKPNEDIMEAYKTGHRIFGENKAQEMTGKWEELPKDIEWHMVGHLQRNKVKYIAPYVSLIHSVDSPRLLKEVNKQARKEERIINCLLQVKIAEEDSKYGLSMDETEALLASEKFKSYNYITVIGLMGMATFTDDKEQLQREFGSLEKFYNKLKDQYGFTQLSMGMSGDYQIAINHGSTMVRVGSAIFGERNYS
ncbi:YggS family pyridoxal phosphate-dependent enzyme [Luteirhabdus pelagi]|uniref:YggS family pyridoxal phosphate-dependent enzyme n=1 Tax=Luteirhabdus pelagi TaxID=2792783 RepID=UPI00193A099B|nr:YggS family pyridoxal phosphate-dependent enzyme [Luteirhabdus pelagi]